MADGGYEIGETVWAKAKAKDEWWPCQVPWIGPCVRTVWRPVLTAYDSTRNAMCPMGAMAPSI